MEDFNTGQVLMKQFLHLHELVFNKPHLCTPEYAETVLAVLKDKLNLEGAFDIKGSSKDTKEPNMHGSLQTIPIVGSMVHRGSAMDAMSGINSYQGIQASIQEALDNPKVDKILLEIDSSGGSVAGAFDLKDFILEAKEHKPIYAIANDTMASAAYLISSACTKVYATQTANVGSIGVVAMHMDRSEANKKEGLKPTFIYAGDYKVAGNPHAALEGEALNYLQESVMDSYEMFVKAVATNRGLDEKAIRATEARVYRGEKAEQLGLVDGVTSLDALIEELASNSTRGSMSKGNKMDKEEFEKLEATLETTKATNETLTKALLDNGFKITAEGVEKIEEEAKEFLEYNGKTLELTGMPEEAAAALKELAAKDADAELEKKAALEFPNFSLDVAKALEAANLSEDVMVALKGADKAYEELMEETGETVVDDMSDPQEKLDALISNYASEHSVPVHKATAEVLKTTAGKELHKETMKKGK